MKLLNRSLDPVSENPQKRDMRIRGFYSILLGWILAAVPGAGFAQTQSAHPKPRDLIVERLGLKGPATLENGVVKPNQDPLPAPKPHQDEEDKTPEPAANSEPVTKTVQNERQNEESPAKIIASKVLLPFYVPATTYLEKRGETPSTLLYLHYKVETKPVNNDAKSKQLSQDKGTMRDIELVVGPDYVAFQSGKSTRIYDLKMRRFLTVSSLAGEDDGDLYFDNVSLFAKAYRNIHAINKASNFGKRTRILLSAKSALDVFWIESAMGWAVKERKKDLEFKDEDNGFDVSYKGKTVAALRPSKTPYPSPVHKRAFFAFSHFELFLHPEILQNLFAFDTVPARMEFATYSPKYPSGQTQIWTLKSAEVKTGEFPLPEQAKSTPERKPVTPLVFVISKAVQNQALGGRPSAEVLSQAYDRAFLGNAYYDAWLLAEKYAALYGPCQLSTRAICKGREVVASLIQSGLKESERETDKTLVRYLEILDQISKKETRSAGLLAFEPLVDNPNVPSFVLRKVALARAKIKAPKNDKIKSLSALAMLKQSLIKDPYDPNAYVGLAQVLAANGGYEQSWDVYDALRAGIKGADRVDEKIKRFEDKVLKVAPAYFGL